MGGKARMTVFMPGPKARTFNDQAGDVGYVPCGRVPLYPEHWGRDTDLSESVQFQPLLGHLSGAVDGEHAQRGHILTTKETGGYWVRKCKKCAGIGRRKDDGCFAWWCRQALCANLFADLIKMKSAGNRGVLQGSLQVLHVHVLFIAPLGASPMAQAGTD